jgi:hypothetical protein
MTLPTQKTDIAKLRKLVSLISETSEAVISNWEKGTAQAETIEDVQLPSHGHFNAQRTLLAALGSVEELVGDPSTRLIGFAMQYLESRALQIAAEHRLPDILQQHGSKGLDVAEVAERIRVDKDKLGTHAFFLLLHIICHVLMKSA